MEIFCLLPSAFCLLPSAVRSFAPEDVRLKFLCLIYLDEGEMAALPAEEMNRLNKGHLALNDDLRNSGHFIEAEALEPSSTVAAFRLRGGKMMLRDGPFTEAKELVAGFYLVEARDRDEAIEIAKRFPSAPYATVEVWPTRQLIVTD